MDLQTIIAELSRPEAYPDPVDAVSVIQTHISAVFVAGDFAYKVKKPVDLGFLDFTTLDLRRHFCEEEVRLNRRLAPDVYLGVVPITGLGEHLVVDGDGPVIEVTVKMRRLPDERTFDASLERGDLDSLLLGTLAQRMAAFHEGAASGPEISCWGGFDTVAGNARENFEQIEPFVGETISRPVFDRLRDITETDLERLRPLIEARAARDVTRDTHGDLHLKHVYSFPGAPPPGDLMVVDCIEFNERFRYADPVADIAFLAMDLAFRDRSDLAHAFTDACFRATGDDEGRMLLPFYVGYRAVVRGKVEGFAVHGAEIPEEQRRSALERARAYFLLALGGLSAPGARPCLALSAGLPGTGKTWLAERLTAEAGFVTVATDRVRKELAGLASTDDASAPVGRGIYTPAWGDRTYAECLGRAEAAILEGRRVVVDGTFHEEQRRRQFLEMARALRVPALVFVSDADAGVIRKRLAARQGDASDADWAIYEALAERWEPLGEGTGRQAHVIDTAAGDEATREVLRRALKQEGLA